MSDSFFKELAASAAEHCCYSVLTVDFEDEGRDYDRRAEFVERGFWEYPGKDPLMEDRVQNLFVGDVVLLKTAMTVAVGLESFGVSKPVNAMSLIAAGKVVENPLDGHKLVIEWKAFEEPLLWFAMTTKAPIELLSLKASSEGLNAEQALLDFALHGKDQDLNAFLSDERWAHLKG